MKHLILALTLAALGLTLPTSVNAETAAPAEAPSFPCSAATSAVERTICASPDLAREDRVMARLYKAASKGALGNGHSALPANQIAWLRSRASCQMPSTAFADRGECLRFHYNSRNLELATYAAPYDRAFALAELVRRDPSAARLVEAVLLYADQPPSSNWSSPALMAARQRIMALLAEPFAKLQSDEDQSYGKSILADDVKALPDLFKSDRHFADTIAILGTYSQSEQTPVPIPCAAVVRNPALLAIGDARFGSTLDNFIPQTDCGTALPAIPALDALTSAIWKKWPECEGTIRFAGYRTFNQNVDAARLGIPRLARPDKIALRRVKGVAPALPGAAIRQLAGSYAADQGYSPGEAKATAQARIADILDSAHECGG